jgi:phage gp36-like protein
VAYCTQADLERAVGGAAQLRQLLDRDGDGYADPDFVAEVLEDGAAECADEVQKQIDLASIVAPYPRILINCNASIAAWWAFTKSSSGRSMPKGIEAAVTFARDQVAAIGRGEKSLGVAPTLTASGGPVQIDIDPNQDRMTRDAMNKAGFA